MYKEILKFLFCSKHRVTRGLLEKTAVCAPGKGLAVDSSYFLANLQIFIKSKSKQVVV
jgi:hypothetical protein